MPQPLAHAQDLYKHFGSTQAVNGVSLSVSPGEIYGLVGSDGAGKTTTMRLLVGALKPDRGSIEVCGFDVLKQTEQARATIGYLSQRFSMYEDLTVLENIRFFAEARGLSATEWLPRSLEILEFVGLEKFKDRRAGHLSGGMKQKLGLASALVTRPRLLLLDEPTTGVDPVTRQDFWQLVIKLVSRTAEADAPNYQAPITNPRESVSVIISTPYMDEASRCHRVGFMKNGQIIAEDTPSNLRSMLNGRILELRGSPLNTLRHIAHNDEDVEDVQAFGDRLHARVRVGRAKTALKRLALTIKQSGGRVDEIRAVPPALEDVFIALSDSKAPELLRSQISSQETT
ncbi:ABC transporter ATP-binding protein [Chloroflexi bacterium CFX5]|nr:ABC transporter ATP-binding protein [Chloroflexota bacterium]MDL1920370.1 ABC transporter ATP-binding protein [Chloroflexi bacterium CFX5]NUQ58890.1 ABC transporter ATP-binding protein [Anaerolineales bacterium]